MQFPEVLCRARQHLEQYFALAGSHSLHNEALVLRKEEEATTSTSIVSAACTLLVLIRLEYLLTIVDWAK